MSLRYDTTFNPCDDSQHLMSLVAPNAPIAPHVLPAVAPQRARPQEHCPGKAVMFSLSELLVASDPRVLLSDPTAFAPPLCGPTPIRPGHLRP